MQLAEECREKYRHRAEEVTWKTEVIVDCCGKLKTHFEDRTISIPDDDETKAELKCVKKLVTSSGNVRPVFDASNTNGHLDKVAAIWMAVHALDSKPEPQAYIEVEHGGATC
jgi:phage FluMu gp28-like protein